MRTEKEQEMKINSGERGRNLILLVVLVPFSSSLVKLFLWITWTPWAQSHW